MRPAIAAIRSMATTLGTTATRNRLRAVKRAGTANDIAVIKALEGHVMLAEDRMRHDDAIINPNAHQVRQTIYLATSNVGTKGPDDMAGILSHSDPDVVRDTDADAACKLEGYDPTPTDEM